EKAREVADEASRLAARQFRDVGVLLLRHDARAGRVAVVEGDEPELARVPDDDVLCEAREVDADHGRDERELHHHVTGGGAVERVLGGSRETELCGDELRVEAEGRARERSPSVRRDARSRRPVAQALQVAPAATRGPAGGERAGW